MADNSGMPGKKMVHRTTFEGDEGVSKAGREAGQGCELKGFPKPWKEELFDR